MPTTHTYNEMFETYGEDIGLMYEQLGNHIIEGTECRKTLCDLRLYFDATNMHSIIERAGNHARQEITEAHSQTTKNFFPTLNDALESEGLVKDWPLGSNIMYNQPVQNIVTRHNEYHLISVYRNEQGYYERTIHYDTL